MAGFGHEATAAEVVDPVIVARNARYGLVLFCLYLVFYATFVGLNAFAPAAMEANIGGVNLAIVYGFGLIVLALVLALLYCWLCRATTSTTAAKTQAGGVQ